MKAFFVALLNWLTGAWGWLGAVWRVWCSFWSRVWEFNIACWGGVISLIMTVWWTFNWLTDTVFAKLFALNEDVYALGGNTIADKLIDGPVYRATLERVNSLFPLEEAFALMTLLLAIWIGILIARAVASAVSTMT
jgi:hypothetical protein